MSDSQSPENGKHGTNDEHTDTSSSTEPSQQAHHNAETEEDTASGGPAD